MDSEVYLRLRDSERTALKEHQLRIADSDKDKRRRAVKEYRQWLDYLVDVNRITPAQRLQLEMYRMDKRHVG